MTDDAMRAADERALRAMAEPVVGEPEVQSITFDPEAWDSFVGIVYGRLSAEGLGNPPGYAVKVTMADGTSTEGFLVSIDDGALYLDVGLDEDDPWSWDGPMDRREFVSAMVRDILVY